MAIKAVAYITGLQQGEKAGGSIKCIFTSVASDGSENTGGGTTKDLLPDAPAGEINAAIAAAAKAQLEQYGVVFDQGDTVRILNGIDGLVV